MPKTQTQRAELALIRIIESSLSTTEQILEATRQLIGIKRVKAVPRGKRKARTILSDSANVLGSK